MTAYERLPLKGEAVFMLFGFATVLYMVSCIICFSSPSESDVYVPPMGAPDWFDKSKESMEQQWSKTSTASSGLLLGMISSFFSVVLMGRLKLADEKVKMSSDRASFSHRKTLALMLALVQALELIFLLGFLPAFASMRLFLAFFGDILLCIAVSYILAHNLLKLYGPDRRDEMMLYEVGLEQEVGDEEQGYQPFKDDDDDDNVGGNGNNDQNNNARNGLVSEHVV